MQWVAWHIYRFMLVALCSSNRCIQMAIPKRLTMSWCLMAFRQLRIAATALAQEWSWPANGPPYPHSYNMPWHIVCVCSALDTQVFWMIRRFGETMAACPALPTSTPRMSPAWWHLPWSRTGMSLGHWASTPVDNAVLQYTHLLSDIIFSWLRNAFMSELAMAGAHGGSDTDLDRAQGLVDERGDQTLRGAFLWGPCWICWMFPHAYHAYHGQDLISQDILVPAWHVPGRLRSCLAEMRMWMWSPTNRCSSQWQLQALWTFTAQIPWKLTWKEADNMINMTAWKGNMHQASIVRIIILGSCLRFRAGTVPDSACQLPSHSRRSVWLDCGCGGATAICGGPFLLVGKDAVAQTVVSG